MAKNVQIKVKEGEGYIDIFPRTNTDMVEGLSNILGGKQESIGYTPENVDNKGKANGYPTLDISSKIPIAQLPDSEWSNIVDRPNSLVSEIDLAVSDSHSHQNKQILDKITGVELKTYDLENMVNKDELGNAGYGDMLKSIYDTDEDGVIDNANKVGGFTVGVNVPSNAKFTDTIYSHPSSHPATMITETTTKRFVSDVEKSGWDNKTKITLSSSKPVDGSTVWLQEI